MYLIKVNLCVKLRASLLLSPRPGVPRGVGAAVVVAGGPGVPVQALAGRYAHAPPGGLGADAVRAAQRADRAVAARLQVQAHRHHGATLGL